MRPAFTVLSLLAMAILPGARLDAESPVFAERPRGDAGPRLVLPGTVRSGQAVPIAVVEPTGNILRTPELLEQVLGDGARGDGGGADVKDLIAIQTTYNDPAAGNTVLLIWTEDFPNPPPLTLTMDGSVLIGQFPPRPDTATFPGRDAVEVQSVPSGQRSFLLESEDGSFTEVDVLVLEEQPFEGVEYVACETGAFIRDGVCEVILSWVDHAPLVDFHYALLGTTPIAQLPATVSGVVLPAATGMLCLDLVSVTSTDDGLYAVQSQACCDIQCAEQACSDPVDLRLHQSQYQPTGTVDVAWRNTTDADINGFLNGEFAGQLARPVSSAEFSLLPPGMVSLGIQASCSAEQLSELLSEDFEVLSQTPFPNPVSGVVTYEYNDVDFITTATWTNDEPAAYIEVFVDPAGDPAGRTFLGAAPPELNTVNITNTGPDDVPVLQFYQFENGFCYGSEPVVAVPASATNSFVRGNCDGTRPAQLPTVLFLFNYLFQNGPPPPCEEACDMDADNTVNLVDGLFLLNFLFQNGSAPVGWMDGDQDGRLDETCETVALERCAQSHDACP